MSTSQNNPVEQLAKRQDVSQEDIAVRAYEKWQQRGCPLGDHQQDDWHAARMELERELSLAALCQPAPSITPRVEASDNIRVQLRNLVAAMFDESPRPATRRIERAQISALRLRA